jgi:tRNA modification GTPase
MKLEEQQAATSGGQTFAARLTAPGRGAIAVVRVWGPRAIEVADAVFRPIGGKALAETRPGELRLGRVGRGVGDEVVAVVHGGAVASVELQCHGGAAVVDMVLRELEAAGALGVDPAVPAGCAGASRLSSLALHDLSFAATVRVAEILLDQAAGALSREIVRVIGAIDQVPDQALVDLEALTSRGEIGLRLLSGWRIVIAGRPNVGKSRLFNAVAGFARAIVDPTPGTTRDVVTIRTSLSGWPVEIADTAGLRATADPLESLGIERSLREHSEADLVVLVLDRSCPLEALDHELLASTSNRVLVANKSDLPPAWLSFDGPDAIVVSAERDDGIPTLLAALDRALVPHVPPAGAAIPFRRDQLEILDRAHTRLKSGNPEGAIAALRSLLD